MKKNIFISIFMCFGFSCLTFYRCGPNAEEIAKQRAKQQASEEAKQDILAAMEKTKQDSIAAIKEKELKGEIIWNDGKYGYFVDIRDKKRYKSVKIGSQTWMAENLAFKPMTGDYWALKDRQDNVRYLGYLYNWDLAKKVCPYGWHLPSDDEWKQLEMYLGMSKSEVDVNVNDLLSSLARGESKRVGIKLKINSAWMDGGESNDTIESGFNALPAGVHWETQKTFIEVSALEFETYFWTSTPSTFENALIRQLVRSSGAVHRQEEFRQEGFSVRCVKD